ncbi:hypothetical protein HDU67_006687 [Dinochytrium kinnereticum]|nr:hypothetical protein HDU67_006687 [Dinochytrium kinnereticum]
MCFIGYFHIQILEEGTGDHREMAVVRACNSMGPDWGTSIAPILPQRVNILRGRMEDSDALGFVDFANKDIHIHSIEPSCTQEEVLFSCAPESFIAMAISETLGDSEVVVVRNVRRFIDYVGYLGTFKYNGFYGGDSIVPTSPRLFDVLIIDAVFSNHFSSTSVKRDMNKAFYAFCMVGGRPVVTGHWGCGAFGGNKVHKFLQQVCAAAQAGCDRLDYSVFHDDALAGRLENLLTKICDLKWTVKDLYMNLLVIGPSHGQSPQQGLDQRINNLLSS